MSGTAGGLRTLTSERGFACSSEPTLGQQNISGTARVGYRTLPVQACLTSGTPLRQQDFDLLIESAESFQIINDTLPEIESLTRCGFIDAAFTVLVEEDCGKLRDDLTGLVVSALLSAIGISLAALYFCVCFRYAFSLRVVPGGVGCLSGCVAMRSDAARIMRQIRLCDVVYGVVRTAASKGFDHGTADPAWRRQSG